VPSPSPTTVLEHEDKHAADQTNGVSGVFAGGIGDVGSFLNGWTHRLGWLG